MKASPRDIRRLAFQTLYQLDARGETDADLVERSLEGAEGFTEPERRKAFALARQAFSHRKAADAATLKLAPTWPSHRQPAVDRAILRLAYYELAVGGGRPAIVINEAIELAKEFSTDRSPGFINGLLDKIAKSVAPAVAAGADEATEAAPSEPESTETEPDKG